MADNNDKAEAEERDYKADQVIERAVEETLAANATQMDEPKEPPQQLFQKFDFNAMPGVSLIVPDGTPPAELIRISATVCEEIGLMVMRKVTAALLG